MRNEILYIGTFKPPDRDAGAVRVRAVADALNVAGYAVTLIGDDYTGPQAIDTTVAPMRRLSVAMMRSLDLLITSSSYFKKIDSIDRQRVAAVICYRGSVALIWRLLHYCRIQAVPLIIDSGDWYKTSHVLGGRLGPFALDSELRMRWMNIRAGNVICDSSFLFQYYSSKGCNVIRVPTPVGREASQSYSGSLRVQESQADQLTLVYAGFPGQKELFAEIIAAVQSSIRRGVKVSFKIVGVTEDELLAIVSKGGGQLQNFDGITCYGRLARPAALKIVAASDFTVILRPQERFANAGFPSKLVESLSLGVPVMANATSDIAEYLRDGQDGYLLGDATAGALEDAIFHASQLTSEQKQQMRINAQLRARECFGYQNFAQPLAEFVSRARPCR